MMLEPFYKNHDYLLEHLDAPVRRQLMDEINWNDRLIAIKGCRGVGKTTFLLQYAKERWGDNRTCLYVDCNNFHFAEHTLVEFAAQFVNNGGRCLLIDQAFKYENWSAELHECYERFPSLQIVISASPVMRLIEGNDDLQKVVKIYNLRGFSFREYLNQQVGTDFRPYTMQEILTRHEVIAQQIIAHVHPSMYFSDYLYKGYYPFCMEENHNFEEQLLKTMNMMLEVDILIIKQIDTAYLPKIRGLLYEMLNTTPCTLNISKLAKKLDTSRATVMNYIKYLKDARLLNLLYPEGKQFPMKPSRVYMQNTNLLYTLPERIVSRQYVAETFFYNALHATHKVYASEREALFAVDTNKMPSIQTVESMMEENVQSRKTYFNVNEKVPTGKQIQRLTAVANIERGEGNVIPLWLFGFLY